MDSQVYVSEGLSPSVLAARAGSVTGLVVCSAQVHLLSSLSFLLVFCAQPGLSQASLWKMLAGPAAFCRTRTLSAPGGFVLPAAAVESTASNDALFCLSLSLQYVIKTVEVESSKTKQALSESQTRNQHLQEQVAMQRQVLKEMEQQLQNSHQLTVQLRAQVSAPRGL